ncbi:hypothetical protein E3Q18_00133 [Wallemia mellicola]|uniref:Bola-like protein n=1 Tax=Wallemia mellicola TaxID=1708541 RepID=A0A4T0M986_9BASI|nr:hypothetical protein E3Q23_00132 [Wallemia mellicola]TIC03732.1 hypothetical protein E3Q18_00133 [Wallemia mellicola]TIC05031.1 hypothetical protein E3Q17_00096 [Wallemia mellicola]TIC14984.1 hypothetical protein E3Q14_00531 [Wallemia mellicola]TIC20757.1 hypothetical protein E3Q13_00423 [Wallemia mellicola]
MRFFRFAYRHINVEFEQLSRQAYKVPSQPAMQGPVHSAIEEKLNEQLKPQSLEIRNDSSLHAHHHAMVIQGGGNGETHPLHCLLTRSDFAVTAISDHFKGMLQIQRHRFVNRLLNHEFEHNGLHALSLRLYTPEEAERIKK